MTVGTLCAQFLLQFYLIRAGDINSLNLLVASSSPRFLFIFKLGVIIIYLFFNDDSLTS